jgi:carboxymethylenebutenolidase
MLITTETVDVQVGGAPMRVLVTAPRAEGKYPAILVFSDIFQLTGAQRRVSARLAGYGFVVATPEIFHRVEPAGAAFAFDDAGRERGLADAQKTTIAEFDASARAALELLASDPRTSPGRVGVMGFCIGGHLAFRAAMQPSVRGTVCFYPTGVHDGRLGKDADAGSLARAADIKGALMLGFGTADPHVPEPARAAIAEALTRAGTSFAVNLYAAEHAFMRDEGPRYDPEAADQAWSDAIAFLRRTV